MLSRTWEGTVTVCWGSLQSGRHLHQISLFIHPRNTQHFLLRFFTTPFVKYEYILCMNLFLPINRDVVIYLWKYVQHLTFDFFKEAGDCSAWWLSPSSSDKQKDGCFVGTEKELWGFGPSDQSWKIVWGMQQWSGISTIWDGRRYFVMIFRSHTHSALAWMTQPPWLHQFHFGWTSAHPITKPGAVTEVESHFIFWAALQESFFSPGDLPCSPNYPI